MSRTYFKNGSWNQECAESGKLVKNTDLVLRYDGLWVLPEHNEPDPDVIFGTPFRGKTGLPARTILKTSKNAMEDDYDADDHTIVFDDHGNVVNPNQP